jgi:hypothetical protein
MCIIIAKPSGVAKPSKEIITKCWNTNSDGAGLMYPNVNGQLSIIKGLMTLQAFMDEWDKLPDGTDIVAHFRIATHGGTNVQNTHPFWAKADEVGVCHNGILPIAHLVKEDSGDSDTSLFVREFLGRLPHGWQEDPVMCHVIGQYLGGANKIVVMDRVGKITIINRSAGTEHEGVWYSNASFKVYQTNKFQPSYDYMSQEDWRDGGYTRVRNHRRTEIIKIPEPKEWTKSLNRMLPIGWQNEKVSPFIVAFRSKAHLAEIDNMAAGAFFSSYVTEDDEDLSATIQDVAMSRAKFNLRKADVKDMISDLRRGITLWQAVRQLYTAWAFEGKMPEDMMKARYEPETPTFLAAALKQLDIIDSREKLVATLEAKAELTKDAAVLERRDRAHNLLLQAKSEAQHLASTVGAKENWRETLMKIAKRAVIGGG